MAPQTKKTVVKKSVKFSKGENVLANCEKHSIAIAVMQQEIATTATRFEQLGDKFDRILSRVEELALSTTSLNTRHDGQIQNLQRQLSGTEDMMQRTREDISQLSDKLTIQITQSLASIVTDQMSVTTEIKRKLSSLDTRLNNLEKWRMLILGGGLVAGAILTKVIDILLAAK